MRIDGACHCGRLSYEADVDPDKAGVCQPPRPGLLVFNLRIRTVRQRAALAPKSQVWCRSALPWVMDLATVRRHSKQSM